MKCYAKTGQPISRKIRVPGRTFGLSRHSSCVWPASLRNGWKSRSARLSGKVTDRGGGGSEKGAWGKAGANPWPDAGEACKEDGSAGPGRPCPSVFRTAASVCAGGLPCAPTVFSVVSAKDRGSRVRMARTADVRSCSAESSWKTPAALQAESKAGSGAMGYMPAFPTHNRRTGCLSGISIYKRPPTEAGGPVFTEGGGW